MAIQLIKNAKTGETTIEEFTFIPPSQAQLDAEKKAKEASALAALDSPVIESLIEEFLSITGITVNPSQVKANAKERMRSKL